MPSAAAATIAVAEAMYGKATAEAVTAEVRRPRARLDARPPAPSPLQHRGGDGAVAPTWSASCGSSGSARTAREAAADHAEIAAPRSRARPRLLAPESAGRARERGQGPSRATGPRVRARPRRRGEPSLLARQQDRSRRPASPRAGRGRRGARGTSTGARSAAPRRRRQSSPSPRASRLVVRCVERCTGTVPELRRRRTRPACRQRAGSPTGMAQRATASGIVPALWLPRRSANAARRGSAVHAPVQPARTSRTGRRPSWAAAPPLPAARLEQLFGRERRGRDPDHRLAEAGRDLARAPSRPRSASSPRRSPARRFTGSPDLKMPGADEHAVGAQLHAERGVRGRGDPAGGEGDDREPAVLGHPAHELVRRAQLLRLGVELVLARARRAAGCPRRPRACASPR